MKFLPLVIAALLSSAPVFANDPPSSGDVAGQILCSDQNKPAVLLVLKRIEKDAAAEHRDTHGMADLIARIKANSKTELSPDLLAKAGLRDAEIHEVFEALTTQE